MEAIEGFSSPEENIEMGGSPQILLNAVHDFQFLCFLSLWSDVLDEINHAINVCNKGSKFQKICDQMHSLKLYFNDLHNTMADNGITYRDM